MLVGDKFPPLTRKNDRASRGIIHKNNNSFSPGEFLIKLKHHLIHNLSDVPNFCRVSILARRKYNLRNTA